MKNYTYMGAMFFLSLTLPAYAESGSCAPLDENGNEIGSCYWVYDPDSYTLKISGNGQMQAYNRYDDGTTYFDGRHLTYYTDAPWFNLNVQNLVVEKGITNIGARAFADMKMLQNVSLSDTIISLDSTAFHNSAVQNINIPDSLKNIGTNALSAMGHLSDIDLNQVEDIGRNGVSLTGVHSLIIPSSVTSLSDHAFGSVGGWAANPYIEALYCSSNLLTRCQEALNAAGSPITVTHYEYDADSKTYLIYDEKGNMVGKYANTTDLKNGVATEKYKYDSAGHLVGIFDGNGQRKWGKKIYTVEEAMEATAHGDKFHVSLTYK